MSETNLIPPFSEVDPNPHPQSFGGTHGTPAHIQCCSTDLERQCRILVLARDNEVHINSINEFHGNSS